MSRILLTWEFGGGLGHIGNLLPLAERLESRGHELFAVVKDIGRTMRLFGSVKVNYFQSPNPPSHVSGGAPLPSSFAQILFNLGFGDIEALCSMTEPWQAIFRVIRPHLAIFDHSPMGLLVSYGFEMKRILVGSGFFTPVDSFPLPDLRPWRPSSPETLLECENTVLRNANRILEELKAPPLSYLSKLYANADKNYLMTFQELDHFGPRPHAHYVGAWTNIQDQSPSWSLNSCQRVFAYLKPFESLTGLLSLLAKLQLETTVVCDGIDPRIRHEFASTSLRFESTPLDISKTASSCDFAILNGSHATTIAFLLAGKPSLQIPLTLEQVLFTKRVVELGSSVGMTRDRPQEAPFALSRMLEDSRLQDAAKQFAAKYCAFDAGLAMDQICSDLESLLTQ